MSKFRPTNNCCYIIPDIHGQYKQLKLILNRILPLRNNKNSCDKIVFLGDYIDRRRESHLVIDTLIEIQNKYKNQTIFLRGNHEQLLLNAIKESHSSSNYMFWMRNGGDQTLSGYLERAGQPMDNPYELPRYRVIDFIPKDHLAFFNSLRTYYETEDHIFVHGGCDPEKPLSVQNPEELVWDRDLYEQILVYYLRNKIEPEWTKPIITGHNGNVKGVVIVTGKFMMLDASYAGNLPVLELNSMSGFVAKTGKDKLFKLDVKEGLF